MEINRNQLLELSAPEFNLLFMCVDEDTEDLLWMLLHDLIDSVEIPDDLIPFSLRV